VVGRADTTAGSSDSALWNGKTITGLAPLGVVGANGINDSGQIAGMCNTGTYAFACVVSNGKIAALPAPATFPDCTDAIAINNNGQIVGGNQIYSNGTLQDLNNLIPAGSPTRSPTPPASTATARSSPRPTTPPPTKPRSAADPQLTSPARTIRIPGPALLGREHRQRPSPARRQPLPTLAWRDARIAADLRGDRSVAAAPW